MNIDEKKKIIRFGMLGALGCFLGWLIGEAFLHVSMPWASPKSARPATSIVSIAQRLQREGAHEGDVEIALAWSNRTDLDLHVIDPDNVEICYNHKVAWRSGGELDVDMNVHGESDQPVEHVYFRKGGAPSGRYKVYVVCYSDRAAGASNDYQVQVKANGEYKVYTGSIKNSAGGEHSQDFVCEFEVKAPPAGRMILIVGIWTALLGMGLTLLLQMGQNQQQNKPWLQLGEAKPLLLGGFVSGAVSGGGGQMLLVFLGGLHSSLIPPVLGQVAGWLLLGVLLGRGVAFFIPNLPPMRATIAGGAGGLIGIFGFLLMTSIVGNVAGRLTGAVILGFAIGAMVAIVEMYSREAWLEIEYAPKETGTVNLGPDPVSVGGDSKASMIFAKNAPPVAYRYWLRNGIIECEDVTAKRTTRVAPGDRRRVGSITVTVRADSRTLGSVTPQKVAVTAGSMPKMEQPPKFESPQTMPVPAASAAGSAFHLRLSTGRTIPLSDGLRLGASDLPGTEGNGGVVAQVLRHPSDPRVYGLKNLSNSTWRTNQPDGTKLDIAPGKTLRLTAVMKIDFGRISGEITG